jgi:hypothetical protein
VGKLLKAKLQLFTTEKIGESYSAVKIQRLLLAEYAESDFLFLHC